MEPLPGPMLFSYCGGGFDNIEMDSAISYYDLG